MNNWLRWGKCWWVMARRNRWLWYYLNAYQVFLFWCLFTRRLLQMLLWCSIPSGILGGIFIVFVGSSTWSNQVLGYNWYFRRKSTGDNSMVFFVSRFFGIEFYIRVVNVGRWLRVHCIIIFSMIFNRTISRNGLMYKTFLLVPMS